ncbi:DNA repair protein RAD16 [Uncinocarpus reesii 1704]|uniref:DNA repair protein RAD16 n=1 Tax=Uncinocarpus reesii (strain UAMH 1704) TaxID=336963 RepID=C4K046_UNCRE|nr:DNA repair protein RAD16 [Uncinocarpus reesii 1704]EEP82932.1 DNA repair protein RAD16 [Uncinocarpus reesii 1704]
MAPRKGKTPKAAPRDRVRPSPVDQNPMAVPSLDGQSLNPRRSSRIRAVAVEIPKMTVSSISSPAAMSESESAQSNSNVYNTPATTTLPTPIESDSMPSRRPKRVSASARALELQNSSFGLRSGRKRNAAELTVQESLTESTDARLALALQAEEYGEEHDIKRRKTFKPPTNRRRVENSTDGDYDELEDISFGLSARQNMDKRPMSPPRNSIPTTESDLIIKSKSARDRQNVSHGLESYLELDDGFITDPEGLLNDDDYYDFYNYDDSDSPEDRLSLGGGFGSDSENSDSAAFFSLLPRHSRFRPKRLTRAERERKKLEEQHPNVATMWEDLQNIPIITPAPAPQPAGISRKLKPFQLEGLSWMKQQEQSQWKGGLLGDEMGMGKTIQAVSLLMSDYPVGVPSLVVVPPVALMQWQSEIKSYTDGKLKVFIYHGSNSKVKNITVKELKSYDIIMISYSGLESMHRKEVKGWTRGKGLVKEDSIIHSIHFHRLILDEAHNIKQRTTSVARACFALKANYKWCLSGTPVQNRIGEFFSLLRFLDVKPFACYFCKRCPCEELHWSQDELKRCVHCKHTIMLRRVKKDHTASMELPPKRQFDTYVSRGVMLNNYANIFGLIMQMRQVANHPDLILKKHAEGGQNVLVCSICDEPAEEAIRSRCKHEFCRQCAKEYIQSFESRGEPDCPRCHIPLSIDFEQPDIEQEEGEVKKNSIINRIKMEDWTSSTKIEMLVYDLYKLRSKKQTHKSIVFSQFTSMLQLVEWRLHRAGISTVMLDGSMTPVQRQKSIDYFMNNVDVEVFLVSLKAGGVALNLTEASRVFIVDPWWNPAAEWQSADRCHRIGQRRPCVITKLCIEDSVESRMVLLQEKKANMINGTINKDQSEALEKLTPEDMEFLFRGN